MRSETGRRFPLAGMVFWGGHMIAAPFFIHTLWILYLLEISQYANFVGHWSGWSAERPTEIEDGQTP